MTDFDVRGAGQGWTVYHKGERIGRIYNQQASAYAAIKGIKRRLDRARARMRPCLCCGRGFASQGIHNRLCEPCRRGYN
ncbi:MAG: hypothetical protein DI533_04530 [Cereibacter sphaeroides]|uniref:Uncharacterized protein n=1 Tax=Cereibacter sphaeroides TaxID=1063 RepID=A0A2W5SGH5_CERSP|nr:MAG: hypothetical protein DI533_04530 [Cereibacter sphaeroides]